MSSFAKISIRFAADLKQFSSQMQNARRDISKIGSQMTSAGKSLTAGLTLPLVGLGTLATKTFADFQQEMAKVKAISGATSAQFAELRRNAEDLGASTRYAASEVAALQLNYSKLGFSPDEIIKATGATLDLALATGEDLAQSAVVAASTLRGFGLDAQSTQRVVDVMAKSFSSSALDLTKFETAMAVVAPVAKVANQSIEDTTGMLSVLVNAGIDASTAGTGLRNIFLDIADKGLTLEEALNQIRTSTNQNKTSMELFGKRGATVATVLAANTDQAKAFTSSYNDAAGSAKKMAEIMDNTLQGSFFKLKSAIESALISLGETLAPAIRKFTDVVSDLIARFKDLSPATRKIIVIVGALAAAIGPVLLVVGTLATTALPALAAGLTVLTGPIGLVIAAIAGIAVVVYKNWDRIKQEMVELRNYFTDLYNESIIFRSAIESVVLVFKTLFNVVKLVLDFIISGFKNGIELVLGSVENLGKAFKALLTGDVSQISEILRQQGELTGKNFASLFTDLGRDINEFTTNMKRDFGDAVDAVAQRKKLTFQAKAVITDVQQSNTNNQGGEDNGGAGGGFGRKFIESVSALKEAAQPILNTPLDYIVEKMPAQAARLTDMQAQLLENALLFNEGLTQIMSDAAASFAEGFGELIGSAAQGGFSLNNIAKLILGTLADMAINVGKMAIGIGTAVEGIKKALQSLAGPVAIAAGIALIALGTFAKSSLSNAASPSTSRIALANGGIAYGPTNALIGEYAGASSNPEVVAPLDKLKTMIRPAAESGPVQVTGEFRLRNDVLVAAVESGVQFLERRK